MSRPYSASSSSRGSYNYRSSDRRQYAPRGRDTAEPDSTALLEGLKDSPLETVPVPPAVQRDDSLDISDVKYLGSYNWTTRETPTILVPGSLSEWIDKRPFRVSPDIGSQITDHNAYHFKEMPLLPLFVAVDANEDADTFDWSAVDIVTDRNGLRRLLRWIAGDKSESFRIDLQLAGKKTILMTRWTNKATRPFSGFTYGTNYFDGTTKKPHGESTAHHRIISYKWNGLNFVVRCTADAFIPSNDIDDIVGAFSSLNVSQSTKSATQVKGTSLEVIHYGMKVSQDSVIEVATISRARESQLNWEEKGPQLYFSQIPHFYVGLHDRGYFTDVRKHKSDYKKLSTRVQENMKKLKHAISTIQSIVIKRGQRGRLSLVCTDGTLKVYERVSEKCCLPEEFMERFGI